MSQSKISRIENGKVQPTLLDLERILRAVAAPPETTEEIVTLARLANTEWQDLRSLRRRGLEKKQTELAALEASTTEFRFFLLSMITGLLSTPEYIRASLAHSPADVTRTIVRKLERQEVLYDTTKRFTFLLTEQAARWPLLPPAAMAVQIDRLASLTHLTNVRLGVIPTAGHKPVAPMDTFTVYDHTLATVENTTGISEQSVVVSKPDERSPVCFPWKPPRGPNWAGSSRSGPGGLPLISPHRRCSRRLSMPSGTAS